MLASPLAAQQFVAELDAGPAVAFTPAPRDAVVANGAAYFTSDAPGFGRELHVTDGTVAGTRVFVDLQPGPFGSSPRALGVLGTRVVVQAGTQLRITDGTPAGTSTLRNGVDSLTDIRWLGIAGSRCVLAIRGSGISGVELVSSDGTAAGTATLGIAFDVLGAIARGGRLTILATTPAVQLVSTDGVTLTPVATLPGTARPGFAAWSTHDGFLVDDPNGNTTLWRTDGTTAGTNFVANFGPTQGSGSLAALGPDVVVGAANGLWRSDGTTAGTTQVSAAVTDVRSLTRAGSVLVFTNGSSFAGGMQLWRTDGTSAGTFLLDATPTSYTHFSVGTTRTYCYATAAGSMRLLRTDGSLAGTVSVPVVDAISYLSLAALGDDAIATVSFGVPGANTGLHAWKTDATAAGAVQLTPATVPVGVVAAGTGAALESTLFFPAATAATGLELWRTDGTAAGTQLVQDFVPGQVGGVNSVVFFKGAIWATGGNGIWRIDGPGSAPVLVLQPDPVASFAGGLVAQDGWLLFRTTSPTGAKFWRSDGTPSGTVLLRSTQALFQNVFLYAQRDDVTYWSLVEFTTTRLWRSDGTILGQFEFGPASNWFAVFGDRVVYARPGIGSAELRAVVGNAATSQPIATVSSLPVASASTGNLLVCVTAAGTAFSTDGIATITPLPLPAVNSALFAANGFVYATVSDATSGSVLWRTDGTVAGTGPAVSFASSGLGYLTGVWPVGAGNRILLDASDGATGNEPWISEGTQATTTLLADLVPNGNSSPQLVGIAGERAYFVAFDPVRGRELWSLDLATVGAANAQPFGVGCPGTNGIPRLAVDGMPAVGRALSLRIDRGAPNSIGLWFVGLGPQHLAVGGGCEFLMTTIAWSDWAFTNAAGAAVTSLFVPNDPVFVGLQVVAQGSFLDPLGVSSFGTTVTEGVLLVLGG